MLFRKKHTRICGQCVHGTKFSEDLIICAKRGVRSEDSSCRKFSYDPCKRIPPRPKGIDFNKYNETDFSL